MIQTSPTKWNNQSLPGDLVTGPQKAPRKVPGTQQAWQCQLPGPFLPPPGPRGTLTHPSSSGKRPSAPRREASPKVFTVTTSLKALVPSLFWARTLNWYAVSGSRVSTSSQLGPGGTDRDSQSWGPNCARFILAKAKRERRQEGGWVMLETQSVHGHPGGGGGGIGLVSSGSRKRSQPRKDGHSTSMGHASQCQITNRRGTSSSTRDT